MLSKKASEDLRDHKNKKDNNKGNGGGGGGGGSEGGTGGDDQNNNDNNNNNNHKNPGNGKNTSTVLQKKAPSPPQSPPSPNPSGPISTPGSSSALDAASKATKTKEESPNTVADHTAPTPIMLYTKKHLGTQTEGEAKKTTPTCNVPNPNFGTSLEDLTKRQDDLTTTRTSLDKMTKERNALNQKLAEAKQKLEAQQQQLKLRVETENQAAPEPGAAETELKRQLETEKHHISKLQAEITGLKRAADEGRQTSITANNKLNQQLEQMKGQTSITISTLMNMSSIPSTITRARKRPQQNLTRLMALITILHQQREIACRFRF